ncbi:MAG: alkaline phosphatase D family protein [Rubripirellula sp.]
MMHFYRPTPVNPRRSQARRYGIERRDFLRYLAMVSAIPHLAASADGPVEKQPVFKSDPFSLGVSSGEPSPEGCVLWTRLSAGPLDVTELPSVPIEVTWEVSEEENFSNIARKGTALAIPQLGHSVHVEVDGLKPWRWYFYRFRAGDATSPVGRTRTAPMPHVMPDQLRFAFTSCQHFETGFFNGYSHMQREDLDLVVHLGDYIYEYGGRDKLPRKHLGRELYTLSDYRLRYAQYRSDDQLRETHRLFPWLVTWDDHEFDNNYADLVSEEDGVSPEEFLARRMNAYQAYYEFMPLRRRSFPVGPNMKLYRKCRYGRLAQFHILDTRQYRTDQPNGDHQKPMVGKVFDPKTTMLGVDQENWLMSGLTRSSSNWNILAQQVMMAPLNRGDLEAPKYSMDQWPGYEFSRRRLLRFLHERSVPNPVVLTGDIHVNWVNDLQLDFEDPNSVSVATELVGTSMTSGGNGGKPIAEYERARDQNSFVRWYNSNRGYVSCSVTPADWITKFQVTPYVDRLGSPMHTAATFRIQSGKAGAEHLG